MFENLLNLVKENAGDAIINNSAIPNEHNNEAINMTANGIMDQLKSTLSSGGASGLTSLFQGGNVASNPVVQNISSSVSQNLMNRFNIDSSQAGGIVQNLIPVVMNQLVNKTNDPNDKSFDLNGILGSLGGGNAGGILNTIKGLFN